MKQQQFDFDQGEVLRDKGIKQSYDHANEVHENWGEQAFNFLKLYMRHNKEFMAEEVRMASSLVVPEPKSSRAWGAIIVRAKKEGLIYHHGYRSVSNAKAHKTPASVWRVK